MPHPRPRTESCPSNRMATEFPVLRRCPAPDPVKFSTLWYKISSSPSFHVCPRCYSKHIQNTIFRNDFFQCLGPVGLNIRCDFNTPRIATTLWPRALAAQTLRNFRAYVEVRSSVQPCHGTGGVTGMAGRWFRAMNDFDMLICQACYENYVLESKFDQYFELIGSAQPRNPARICDFTVPFVKRAFAVSLKSGDWDRFISASIQRRSVPSCKKDDRTVTAMSKVWYRAQIPTQDILICEECYLDTAAMGPFSLKFKRYCRDTGVQVCSMGIQHMRAAWDMAVAQGSFHIWHDAVHMMVSSPACLPSGILNGLWYSLGAGYENFDVCPSCYACLINALPIKRHFQRVDRPSGLRVCALNPANPRFKGYTEKLTEASLTRNISVFADYVQRTSNLYPCPRLDPTHMGVWHEGPGFLVCELCYEDVIRGTFFAFTVQQQCNRGTTAHTCDLFSDEMRRHWYEASAKNNFADFEQAVNHRARILLWTALGIQKFLERADFRMKLRIQAYQELNNPPPIIDPSAMITSPFSYGSSAADAERLAQLEVIWKEVE